MLDRKKIIAWLADEELYYRDHGDTHNSLMACYALDLLKEQQEQIDRLIEESASNAEIAEGLNELLKEQKAVVKQWTKEIADNQLAHAPNDSYMLMSLDEHLENEYKRGIWDGLQIAWNIISEGR